jgi:hypothetical protein
MAFGLSDLEILATRAVEVFTADLAKGSDGHGLKVSGVVDRLLGNPEFAYGVAARLALHEQTLDGTHAIVSLCDELPRQLQPVAAGDAGVCAGFARLLGLRDAAARRRDLHA